MGSLLPAVIDRQQSVNGSESVQECGDGAGVRLPVRLAECETRDYLCRGIIDPE